MVRGIAFVAALLLAAAAYASGLERFQVYVRTTQSARADFDQQVFDRGGKRLQESKGTFVFLRPGRFRWSYAKPYPQVIVGDGARVWIHDIDLNQVTVRKLTGAIGATPAALLAGASDIDKAFELSEAGTRDGLEWVEAKPREREAGFDRVRIGLGVAGVEAMELQDHFGQTTLLRFTNIARNPKLDANEFRFTPPPGTDVLGEQ
ncbi:MAG: outer membrane lipoprotein carrier protein LolA [Betaproteobacteria bacterium RIFCSPLOWO2_02_FULL_66_14]|nr:MAG: outer membrane lipoprotein carrier protein LolA [Betaproteobacteria bacterium RIFCSPLOWO2_02_FULL_66_14]